MQKKIILALLLIAGLALLAAGCGTRTWQFTPIDAFRPAESVPPASACKSCHESEFASWKKTRHADDVHMTIVPVEGLRGCGACHDNVAGHAADPSVKPGTSPAKMTKTEQNTVCGKCHFNQDLLGSAAINPADKHALYKNVGFEGREQQIACLDCHSGHKGRTEMLVSMKAHVCYNCHKGAIVTMGIFQPFNYLTFGKTCQACHSVHGGSSGAQAARMGAGVCVICHFTGVALVD